MRLDISPMRAFPAGALALLLTLGSAPGCLSPASAEALVSTGFATPQQTVASFQTYLRADLPQREFRCFSMGFRERNGLSALSYGEAREELFRNQPWLKLVAGAKVAAQRSGGEGVHWMDLETVGRTVRVKLAREDIYEILAGEELLTDGEVNFESAARLSERSGKSSLNVRLNLDPPPAQLEGMSQVRLMRQWKIDDIFEAEEPLDGPESGGASPSS